MKKNTFKNGLRASFSIVMSLILILGFNMPAIAANDSSSIKTTTSTGEAVNSNHYESKQEVYIQFGSNLPEGTWSIIVSQPGGEELGTGTQVVTVVQRTFKLWDITQFSDSTSGVYNVDAIIYETNNGGNETRTMKSDNFKVDAVNEDQDPEGGDEDPEGGDEDPEGGDEDPEGGDEDPEGGDDDPEGEDDDPEGEDEDPEGEDEDPEGEDEDHRVVRPRRDRRPREEEVVVDEVPVEEIPLSILAYEAEEELDPSPVVEEELVEEAKEPLALPNTGATSEGLMGLSLLISAAGLLIARKKL